MQNKVAKEGNVNWKNILKGVSFESDFKDVVAYGFDA